MPDCPAQHTSSSDDEGINGSRSDDDYDDDFEIDTSTEDPAHHTEMMSDPGDNRAYMAISKGKKELISDRCESCSSLGYGYLVPGHCAGPYACKHWRSLALKVCGACSVDLPRNPKLCDNCQRWNTGQHSCRVDQVSSRQSVHQMLGNKDCILCRPVGTAVLEKIRATWKSRKLNGFEVQLTGPFYKDRRDYRNVRDAPQNLTPIQEVGGKRKIKCKFKVIFYVDGKSDRRNMILIPLKLYYRSGLGDLRGVKPWRSPYIDIRSLRKAMATCEELHANSCQPDLPPLPDGVRLIDTEGHRLIRPDPEQKISFVALSYVCAATAGEPCRKLSIVDPLSFEEPGALKREDYPRLIWDAMVMCAELGERYLWVDCLCIIQDDREEKLRQIQAMDRIYSCAKLTIVVTADWDRDDGIPGIRNRPRSSWWEDEKSHLDKKFDLILDFNFTTDVMDSRWNYRGWTYQEQCLSRRKIFVSNHRSFFTCQKMDFQENRGRRAFNRRAVDVRQAPPTMWLECWDDYMNSIEDYTARRLSFNSDILHAFAGYSRVAAKQLDTRMLFGMPERYISRALRFGHRRFWERRDNTEGVPSWSWAAWCGMADFDAGIGYLQRHVYGCLVVFHCSDPDEGLIELREEDWWFWDEDFPEDNQPCEWVFGPYDFDNWPTRPSYDWRECPHNREELENHLEIDEPDKIIAARHPNSLVFNTTIARLFLKSRLPASSGPLQLPDIVIHNESGQIVGIIDKNSNLPVPDWIDPVKRYEIIVIGAAVLSTDVRQPVSAKDLMPMALHSLWLEPPTREHRSPWVLAVMVVQRRDKERNVMERLGTGFVLMEFWRDCEPTWETVVLV